MSVVSFVLLIFVQAASGTLMTVYCSTLRNGLTYAQLNQQDVCYRVDWEAQKGNRVVCMPTQGAYSDHNQGCPADTTRATGVLVNKVHPSCDCTDFRNIHNEPGKNGDSRMCRKIVDGNPICYPMLADHDVTKGDDDSYYGCPVDMEACEGWPIRLVAEGPYDGVTAGRLEVYHNGQWGTVCDDEFTQANADVACRQLGLGPPLVWDGVSSKKPFEFDATGGSDPQPIWLDGSNSYSCHGHEPSIASCVGNRYLSSVVDCAIAGPSCDTCTCSWGDENCGHSEDVGLLCSSASKAPTEAPAAAPTEAPANDPPA